MSADSQLLQIEERAAAWLVERDQGLAPERERELTQWLQADPRHAAAFAALAETWNLIGERATVDAPGAAHDGERAGEWRRWRVPLSLAAAALVAVAATGIWRAPEETRPAGSSRAAYVLEAATEVGGQRALQLPDGSIIGLNTDSAVEVRFEADLRRVRLLRGEAHFTVARQPERPFIVSAAGVDVRVVGTIFNIRLRPESVDVLVTEGKVRVGAAVDGRAAAEQDSVSVPAISELIAHQKVSIARVAAPALPLPVAPPVPVLPVEVSPAEIRQALAWQTQRLDFDGTPLREIVAEFNRYNRHKLVVADPRLESQRFGGSFPASDYTTFVRMLEADFGVVAERTAGETRLRGTRP